MYPNTKFDIIDQSQINQVAESNAGAPLFMYCTTTDKGPEDMRVINFDQLKLLYGKVSYLKHGQPLLQVARSLQSGANVLIKRIVAPDALLANTVIVAKLKTVQEQKVNELGQPLYVLDGTETIDSTGGALPVMIDVAQVKYEAQSITGVKTVEEANVAAETLFSDTLDVDGYKTYPLFLLTDVGRGVSDKKFRISADFVESKRYNYTQYQLDVFENSELLETLKFSFDYNMITNNENVSLQSVVTAYSKQMRAKLLGESIDLFVAELTTITGRTDLLQQDIIFGKLKTSKDMQGIKIADTSVSLSHVYGIKLNNGSNGSFGDRPVGNPAVETEMVKFFRGELDQLIYDVDEHKIDAVVDADYPAAVKRAIEDLAEFRGDFFYFRDLGFVSTFDSIKAVEADVNASRYSASYMNSFDIIDPYSKKQIKVTMGYALARILVDHFKNGRHRPLAGKINNAIITEVVDRKTVNYLPTVTPTVNQKEQLTDARINYASFFDGEFRLETQYTSQIGLSQLSYVNNVLATQELIKAIRTKCPKIRYSFIDGEDLETYRKDVEAVINRYRDNFASVEFEYIQEAASVQNKVFKAAISVRYRDYAESEYFTIYALS